MNAVDPRESEQEVTGMAPIEKGPDGHAQCGYPLV